MRKLIFIFAVVVFAAGLPAQETNSPVPLKISAAAATNYYDKEMIVTGKVVQVTIRPTITYLNLDEKYPGSPFAVVIFHGKSSFFGNANALKRKSIEVKGKIKNYHDKPEIVLDSTNQLTVIGVTIWNSSSSQMKNRCRRFRHQPMHLLLRQRTVFLKSCERREESSA
jgi:DNA/RNA endonuclease YhcR with UshA esterase domain